MHPGEHPALVDPTLWHEVQALLQRNRQQGRVRLGQGAWRRRKPLARCLRVGQRLRRGCMPGRVPGIRRLRHRGGQHTRARVSASRRVLQVGRVLYRSYRVRTLYQGVNDLSGPGGGATRPVPSHRTGTGPSPVAGDLNADRIDELALVTFRSPDSLVKINAPLLGPRSLVALRLVAKDQEDCLAAWPHRPPLSASKNPNVETPAGPSLIGQTTLHRSPGKHAA
jgi:hypothetical protein